MATRFYFSATVPAAVNPAFSAADWQHINPLRRALTSVKGNSAITTVTYSPDTADHLVFARSMICQFVSEPLPPQMIAPQPVKVQVRCRELATSDNLYLNWRVHAVSADGQTVLGTLVPMKGDGLEAAGSAQLVNRSDIATTTAFETSKIFRLVVELGLGGQPTMAGGIDGHNAEMSFGEAAATDLPEDDLATTATNPWIQFAHNLYVRIGQSITYRMTDVCAGGCHLTLETDVAGGQVRQLVYDVDQQRKPLTDLAEDERLRFLENVLRINLADKTREEIMADFEAGPVTVTI